MTTATRHIRTWSGQKLRLPTDGLFRRSHFACNGKWAKFGAEGPRLESTRPAPRQATYCRQRSGYDGMAFTAGKPNIPCLLVLRRQNYQERLSGHRIRMEPTSTLRS